MRTLPRSHSLFLKWRKRWTEATDLDFSPGFHTGQLRALGSCFTFADPKKLDEAHIFPSCALARSNSPQAYDLAAEWTICD